MTPNEPEAYTLAAPVEPSALVYDSPHSGRYFPPEIATAATPQQLRWAEDAYVDQLLDGVVPLGVTVLAANWARAYLDLNRAVTDIDESLLDAPWPDPVFPTDKTRRGLGLIRRFVVPGVPIYQRPLRIDDARERIARLHAPYHRRLAALLEESRRAHGVAWHVNWHSMKARGNAMTPDGPNAVRPDFVVSDGHGTTAAASFTLRIVETLRALGYQVALNDPYAGGAIVQQFGKPADGVHSVQIEINRRLYLDEAAVTTTAGFAALRRDLQTLTTTLLASS